MSTYIVQKKHTSKFFFLIFFFGVIGSSPKVDIGGYEFIRGLFGV